MCTDRYLECACGHIKNGHLRFYELQILTANDFRNWAPLHAIIDIPLDTYVQCELAIQYIATPYSGTVLSADHLMQAEKTRCIT